VGGAMLYLFSSFPFFAYFFISSFLSYFSYYRSCLNIYAKSDGFNCYFYSSTSYLTGSGSGFLAAG